MWYGHIGPLQVFPSFVSYDSDAKAAGSSSAPTEVTVTPASSGVFEDETKDVLPEEEDAIGFPALQASTSHTVFPDLLAEDDRDDSDVASTAKAFTQPRAQDAPAQITEYDSHLIQQKPRVIGDMQHAAVSPQPRSDWRTLLKDLDSPPPVRRRTRPTRARSPSPEDPLAAFLATTLINAETEFHQEKSIRGQCQVNTSDIHVVEARAKESIAAPVSDDHEESEATHRAASPQAQTLPELLITSLPAAKTPGVATRESHAGELLSPATKPPADHADIPEMRTRQDLPTQASTVETSQASDAVPSSAARVVSPGSEIASTTSSKLVPTAVVKKLTKAATASKRRSAKYVDVMADFDNDLYASDNGPASIQKRPSAALDDRKTPHAIDQAASFADASFATPAVEQKSHTSPAAPASASASLEPVAPRRRAPISIKSGLEALSHHRHEQPACRSGAFDASTNAARVSHFVAESGGKSAEATESAATQDTLPQFRWQPTSSRPPAETLHAQTQAAMQLPQATVAPDCIPTISSAAPRDTMNVSSLQRMSRDKTGSAEAEIVDSRYKTATTSDPIHTSRTQMRAPCSNSTTSSIHSAERLPSVQSELSHPHPQQDLSNSWQSFAINNSSSSSSKFIVNSHSSSSSRRTEPVRPSHSGTIPFATEDSEAGWLESVTVRQGTGARLPPAKWRAFQEQPIQLHDQTFEKRAYHPGAYCNDGISSAGRAMNGTLNSPSGDLEDFDRILDGF